MTTFLGINVGYRTERGCLTVSSPLLIDATLCRLNMEDAKSVSTLIGSGNRIKEDECWESLLELYLELVAALLYLASTVRPIS